MSWLVSYALAALVVGFLLMRIFDYLLSGVVGWLGSMLRAGLFVLTGTSTVVVMGLRDFSRFVRRMRQASRDVSAQLEVLPNDEGR